MDLICRFVEKDGEIIGESIDVFEGHLIVKRREKFIGVPLNVVELINDKIIVRDFDEKRGEEVGEKWIEKTSKPITLEELEIYGFGEK